MSDHTLSSRLFRDPMPAILCLAPLQRTSPRAKLQRRPLQPVSVMASPALFALISLRSGVLYGNNCASLYGSNCASFLHVARLHKGGILCGRRPEPLISTIANFEGLQSICAKRQEVGASKSFSYLTHGYVMQKSHKCGQLEKPRAAELCSRRGQSFSSCAPASPSAPSA